MSETQGRTVGPGWYADPYGAPLERWWDGTAWTEYTQGTASTVAQQLKAPAGTSTSTVPGWIVAVSPLLAMVPLFFFNVRAYLGGILLLERTPASASSTQSLYELMFHSGYLAIMLGGLVVLAIIVVCSWLDERILKARGVPKPFPWGWSFLETGAVYIIGRAVVVRRRTGQGLAPLWVWIACLVLTFFISAAWAISSISAVLPELQQFSR